MASKHVVVIASGETERRALPHLLSDLHGVAVRIRIPPGNHRLTASMVEKLIKASWHDTTDPPPDKFVVLLDLDGKDPGQVIGPLREELQQRLHDPIRSITKYAHAQRHLEAWYFGDAAALRGYLERALGNVDTSRPDQIENPKLHLKHLLGRVYTARDSEEIAKVVDPRTIAARSDSFAGFMKAVMNGASSPTSA